MDAIKKLALQHGEKLGMLIILAVAGYIVYSSLGQETLPVENQHERLATIAQQTASDVQNYTWQKALEKAPDEVPVHLPLASSEPPKVQSDNYAIAASGWDQQIVPETVLRTDPKLLPPTDFEVDAVTGLFAFYSADRIRNLELAQAREAAERAKAAAEGRELDNQGGRGGRGSRGGEARGGRGMEFGNFGLSGDLQDKNMRAVSANLRPEGIALSGQELIQKMSCAVVVAKVPIEKQIREYLNVLENSRGYNPLTDYPRYFGYIVERTEVVRGEEPNWQQLDIRNGRDSQRLPGVTSKVLEKAVYDWAQFAVDPSDPRFSHPVLTFPSPPLIGRDWGDSAKHSEVPLAIETERAMMDAEREAAEGASEDSEFFGDSADPNDPNDPYGRGGFGGHGGEGMPMGGRPGMGMRGGMGMGGGHGGGEMGMMMSMGGAGGYAAGGMFNEGEEARYDVPFIMLRFFDFAVQPGKRYKYRVKLVVHDVNFRVPKNYLDQTVVDRLQPLVEKQSTRSLLYSEFSEPSPTVSVPQSGRGLLAEVKPPRESNPNAEPETNMLVSAFTRDEKGFAIRALVEKEFRLGSLLSMVGTIEYLVEQNRFIKKTEDAEINTGITLIDVTGGEDLNRDYSEPSIALMLDGGGQLFVANELEDEIEVATFKAIFSEEKPNSGIGVGRGEDFYPEMGGEAGGFFGDF